MWLIFLYFLEVQVNLWQIGPKGQVGLTAFVYFYHVLINVFLLF